MGMMKYLGFFLPGKWDGHDGPPWGFSDQAPTKCHSLGLRAQADFQVVALHAVPFDPLILQHRYTEQVSILDHTRPLMFHRSHVWETSFFPYFLCFVASQHHPQLSQVRIGGGWHVLRNDPEPSEKTESAAGTALAVPGSLEGYEGIGRNMVCKWH